MKLKKRQRVQRIHKRIRKKISGTAERPRISIYRSNKQIYAQLIDDEKANTLLAASSKEDSVGGEGTKVEIAFRVGKLLAEKAVAAGYEAAVFDRGGYLYHGRVKALAEGAREGGLKF